MSKKVLIVQRVLTRYRYELLQELAPHVDKLGFITSQGEEKGTLKAFIPKNIKYKNIEIHQLKAIKLSYTGESRSTSLFLYPQCVKIIKNYDTIILEGTTNVFNNMYMVPLAKIMRKRVIWWDAGYSLNKRSMKRKTIDKIVYPLIKMSDVQFAYSTKAKKYMESYMGASNCHLLLNTINTEYFESIQDEIIESIKNRTIDKNNIKLLYVGAIEERKKIKELIDIVIENNENNNDKKFTLTIVGAGNYLGFLKKYIEEKNIDYIKFTGAIYDKEKLKKYYFDSSLFVLPGDGGLGILQSLLYGLPAVCTSADGTEEDYMDKKYILNNIEDFLFLNFNDLLIDYNFLYNKTNSTKYIIKLKEII